jgi:class 3 adenylate cyclase
MGIHSGPVSGVIDATGKANVAGAGINMAPRVMDCGDAGHILLSKHVAEDLEEYPHWEPHLHDLGECEVKHGVRVSVVNVYTVELGKDPYQRWHGAGLLQGPGGIGMLKGQRKRFAPKI